MAHMRTKLTLAGIILVAAVTYLAVAGVKQGWVYHVPVDEFVNSPEYRTQRVRLAGVVSPEGLQVDPAGLTANFTLKGKDATLPVAYHGTIPDLFKADTEVVVEGRLDPAGVFAADVLMTKCASKYQSEEHAQKMKEQS